jgi:hypothetical protein
MGHTTVDDINIFLREELRRRKLVEVTAVEAARWLDEAGLLADSPHRPGLPLRNLLRRGDIHGAVQRPPRPNGRWFISAVDTSSKRPENDRVRRLNPNPEESATEANREARTRREEAAARYKPDVVDLLLVAEAPPHALDRYFYFEDVREQDSLFRYVCRVVLDREPTREAKPELLKELRGRGVFLIDLLQDPVDGTPLSKSVPGLVERSLALNPRRIILIKATVFDTSYSALEAAGLPVSNVRVPFPGSGRQRDFVEAFGRALRATT